MKTTRGIMAGLAFVATICTFVCLFVGDYASGSVCGAASSTGWMFYHLTGDDE